MTKTAQRIGALCVALKVLDAIPPDLEILRTRAGRNQRAAGAWSWSLYSREKPAVLNIGSVWPARELLRLPAAKIGTYTSYAYDIELIPKDVRAGA